MDNLLEKTLHFLFIPEASLSVAFLVIFILMFAGGFWLSRKCYEILDKLKEKAEADYTKRCSKMSPNVYLAKETVRLSDEEERMESLPNSFVSVGILATFIGLGVAIQGAADLLQADKVDLMKMTDVLGVIAFKFQTSIWGIAFSLLFQSFVVNRYLEKKQDELDTLIDRLYEIEGNSSRLLLEEQNALLREEFLTLHRENANALNLLKEQQRQALAKMQFLHEEAQECAKNRQLEISNTLMSEGEKRCNEADRLQHVTDDIYVHLNSYTEASHRFMQSTQNFTATAQAFAVTAENLKMLVKQSEDNFKEAQERLGQLQGEVVKQIGDNQEAMRKVFKNNAVEFAGRTKQILSESVKDAYLKYQSDAKSIAEKYQMSALDLADRFSLAAKQMEERLEKLSKEMVFKQGEEQKKLADNYLKEAVSIRQNIDGIGPCLNGLDNYVRSMMAQARDWQEETALAAKGTQNATQDLTKASESLLKSMQKSAQNLGEAAKAQSMSITELSLDLSKQVKALSESQAMQSDMFNKAASGIDKASRILSNSTERMEKYQQQQASETLDALIALKNTHQDQLNDILANLEKERQDNTKVLTKKLQEHSEILVQSWQGLQEALESLKKQQNAQLAALNERQESYLASLASWARKMAGGE